MSKYNGGGWLEDLPDLNVGRFDHGCGHYVDSNNNNVGKGYNLFLKILLIFYRCI